MSYEVFIGDKAFSTWSLRGWLLFEKFGIPYTEKQLSLFDGSFASSMATLSPARFVPTMRAPDGNVVGDSLAILETLAETHPEAGHWPKDPAARAYARWLVAEMHAGFAALRSECAMQLFHQWQGFSVSPQVQSDLDRLDVLLSHALDNFSGEGPWLFGSYSAADAFYAPVAGRVAGFDLPVSDRLRAYFNAHLSDDAFQAWRAEGIKIAYEPLPYDLGLPTKPWPEKI